MAVNLLEEDRLVYHDVDVETLEITVPWLGQTTGEVVLIFLVDGVMVAINRGAVETIRDALTCWLETGKLK